MSIVIKPLSTDFTVKIKKENDEIVIVFRQLPYRIKSMITSLCTTIEKGNYTLDATMQMFYNIKYGLKSIEGVQDEQGKPYKLQFEDAKEEALTDDCVDALLATKFSDQVLFTARELSEAVLPTAIKHPITGRDITGIEIVPITGVKKK